jgi:hypothetical protein
MPLSSRNEPGLEAELRHRRERFTRKADAAQAARQAGHKPLLRRLLERVWRRRAEMLDVKVAAYETLRYFKRSTGDL